MGCKLAGPYTGESATKGDGFFAFYEAPAPICQEAQPAGDYRALKTAEALKVSLTTPE
jgi:hypothetical protein